MKDGMFWVFIRMVVLPTLFILSVAWFFNNHDFLFGVLIGLIVYEIFLKTKGV